MFKNWSRPLFRPKTNHTCHQKPNPSRETVPLSRALALGRQRIRILREIILVDIEALSLKVVTMK
jgi:hypothetical protein